MAEPNFALSPPLATTGSVTQPSLPPELERLLASAAELAASHGLEVEVFIQAAWSAVLDARPGLREELEDKALKSQLRSLRKRGLIGAA